MNITKALCASILCCAPFSLCAQTAPDAAEKVTAPAAPEAHAQTEQQICETLKKRLQGKLGLPVDSVTPTPMKGVYEAVAQGEILYTDAQADHILVGQLFETATQKNLTAETKDRLNRIDFSTLPLQDAIKTVKGNGSRVIAVFSDPNCSFCKKLEVSLKDMKDVTIYTFLYPVIRPSSKAESKKIWCAKDRASAWHSVMVEGKPAPEADPQCDASALERNIALGSRLGVTGTPTVFAPTGQRAPGAVSLEYLEKMLSENK